MEIGMTKTDEEWDWAEEEYEETNAVHSGAKCFYCQKLGHFARDCPAKGKGKGKDGGYKGKGKGKGKDSGGKAGGKDSGKGWKGTGKGYQGTCWRCWKVGHKAAECEVKVIGQAEETSEEENVIWSVGSVEEMPQNTEKSSRRLLSLEGSASKPSFDVGAGNEAPAKDKYNEHWGKAAVKKKYDEKNTDAKNN